MRGVILGPICLAATGADAPRGPDNSFSSFGLDAAGGNPAVPPG